MSSKKLDPKIQNLLVRAIETQKKIDRVKKYYRTMDDITEKLRKLNFTGEYFGKYDIFLEDNFEKKNVMFRTTSFRRFDLKIVKFEK